MGYSRFSGPVYGAKSMIWGVGPATQIATTNATTSRPFTGGSHVVVPPYEDWFVTEFRCGISTCSSVGNSIILKSKGGSTSILPAPWGTGAGSTVTQTLSNINTGTSTTLSTWATITPTAGEVEGAWVPAGSTLYVVSSGVNPLGGLNWNVMGYIRFRSSTRAE